MSSRGWMRRRGGDGGQLMLLSGIVITIAFILTALTLSQVSALERQAATDKQSNLPAEWRFLHERIGNNLQTAVTPEMRNETFANVTFPTVVATFRNIESEKGYDVVIRLANESFSSKNELQNLTASDFYNAWSLDGTTHYAHAYDGVNDGLITSSPCIGGGTPSCIVGVYVYLHVTDGVNTMEEYILFPITH